MIDCLKLLKFKRLWVSNENDVDQSSKGNHLRRRYWDGRPELVSDSEQKKFCRQTYNLHIINFQLKVVFLPLCFGLFAVDVAANGQITYQIIVFYFESVWLE